MKLGIPHSLFIIFLLIAPLLSSCNVTNGQISVASPTTNVPLQTNTTTLIPVKTQEVVLFATPSPTKTFLPQPTIGPTQAADSISHYLQESIGCNAPCFLGIVPGETTYNEAAAIFFDLGLQPWTVENDERINYGIQYIFNSGLEIYLQLLIKNDIVQWSKVGITPEKQQQGVPRDWLAYSPEVLIKKYGTPSRVFFMMGSIAPPQLFTMAMFFDDVDLIVEYASYAVEIRNDVINFCPTKDQFEHLTIWLGENPEHHPNNQPFLEDVSTLTLSEFSEILTSGVGNGCVILDPKAFP